jgi:hypothetical protein
MREDQQIISLEFRWEFTGIGLIAVTTTYAQESLSFLRRRPHVFAVNTTGLPLRDKLERD